MESYEETMVNLRIKWTLALARLGNLASGSSELCVYLFFACTIIKTNGNLALQQDRFIDNRYALTPHARGVICL